MSFKSITFSLRNYQRRDVNKLSDLKSRQILDYIRFESNSDCIEGWACSKTTRTEAEWKNLLGREEYLVEGDGWMQEKNIINFSQANLGLYETNLRKCKKELKSLRALYDAVQHENRGELDALVRDIEQVRILRPQLAENALSTMHAQRLYDSISKLHSIMSSVFHLAGQEGVAQNLPVADLNELLQVEVGEFPMCRRLTKDSNKKLRLAFMGQTGQGKSTMINHLVGANVSNTGNSISNVVGVTKVPLVISYGENEKPVYKLKYREDAGIDEDPNYKNSIAELEIRDIYLPAYLCVDVKIKSDFLRDNAIELVDLPGNHGADEVRLCEPFITGDLKADILFVVNGSRSPDRAFIELLTEVGFFDNQNEDVMPRVVELFNQHKNALSSEQNGIDTPLSELCYSQFMPDFNTHRWEFYYFIKEYNEQNKCGWSPNFVQHLVRRFDVAVFLGNNRLHDTRIHFIDIIEKTFLMKNYKTVSDVLQKWKRLVYTLKEAMNVQINGVTKSIHSALQSLKFNGEVTNIRGEVTLYEDCLREALEEAITSESEIGPELLPLAMERCITIRRNEILKEIQARIQVWKARIQALRISDILKMEIIRECDMRVEEIEQVKLDDPYQRFQDPSLGEESVNSISLSMINLRNADDIWRCWFQNTQELHHSYQDLFDAFSFDKLPHQSRVVKSYINKMTQLKHFFSSYEVAGPLSRYSAEVVLPQVNPQFLKSCNKTMAAIYSGFDELISMVAPHLHWRKSGIDNLVYSKSQFPAIARQPTTNLDAVWKKEIVGKNEMNFNVRVELTKDSNIQNKVRSHERIHFASATINTNSESISFAFPSSILEDLQSLGKASETGVLHPVFALSKSLYLEQLSCKADNFLRKCIIAVVDNSEFSESDMADQMFNPETNPELKEFLVYPNHQLIVLQINLIENAENAPDGALHIGRKRQLVKLFAEEALKLQRYWVSDGYIDNFRQLDPGLDKTSSMSRALLFGQKTMVFETNQVEYNDSHASAYADIVNDFKAFDINFYNYHRLHLWESIRTTSLDDAISNKLKDANSEDRSILLSMQRKLLEIRKAHASYRVSLVGIANFYCRNNLDLKRVVGDTKFSHICRGPVYNLALVNTLATRYFNYMEPAEFYNINSDDDGSKAEKYFFDQLKKARRCNFLVYRFTFLRTKASKGVISDETSDNSDDIEDDHYEYPNNSDMTEHPQIPTAAGTTAAPSNTPMETIHTTPNAKSSQVENTSIFSSMMSGITQYFFGHSDSANTSEAHEIDKESELNSNSNSAGQKRAANSIDPNSSSPSSTKKARADPTEKSSDDTETSEKDDSTSSCTIS